MYFVPIKLAHKHCYMIDRDLYMIYISYIEKIIRFNYMDVLTRKSIQCAIEKFDCFKQFKFNLKKEKTMFIF